MLHNHKEKNREKYHFLNYDFSLQKFGFDFAEYHMNNSEAQVERVKKTIENFTTNLANAWNRPNCGYFDETTNKGGPDPNPDGGVRNELFRSGFEILRELREGSGWVWGK